MTIGIKSQNDFAIDDQDRDQNWYKTKKLINY